MAKYQGSFRDHIDDPIEEEIETPEGENEADDDLPAKNREEETWKKRHGDLRRHTAKKEQELSDRIKKLEEQLTDAVKKGVEYPETEEEVEKWLQKFPKVGKIVQTIALKANEGTRSEFETSMAKLKEIEAQNKRDRAYNELLKIHPDFPEIRDSDEFHDWLEEKGENHWVHKALYNDDSSVEEAANAISFYKDVVEAKKKPKKDKEKAREEASAVPRSRREAPSGNEKAEYSESMVKKNMNTPGWFDKHEEAIEKAIAEGRFDYDISNAR